MLFHLLFLPKPYSLSLSEAMLSYTNSCGLLTATITGTHQHRPSKGLPLPSVFQSQHPRFSFLSKSSLNRAPTLLAASKGEENEKERPKLRWVEIGPNITEAQKQAISQLPPKMTKRCKALMRRIICFSPEENGDLTLLLSTWVKLMKPRRADWLSVLKEMKTQENPLFLQVCYLLLIVQFVYVFDLGLIQFSWKRVECVSCLFNSLYLFWLFVFP